MGKDSRFQGQRTSRRLHDVYDITFDSVNFVSKTEYHIIRKDFNRHPDINALKLLQDLNVSRNDFYIPVNTIINKSIWQKPIPLHKIIDTCWITHNHILRLGEDNTRRYNNKGTNKTKTDCNFFDFILFLFNR